MTKGKRVGRVFIRLLVAFVLIFLLRWGYEVAFTGRDVVIQYTQSYENVMSASKNIASDRVRQKDTAGKEVLLDQKYDQTATMSAHTDTFDAVYDSLRAAVEGHEAVIQTENLSGLAGERQLEISIGVMPERFDALVEAVQGLGELRSFQVTKVDKTDEYRTLMAEMATLEKSRDAYNALKLQGGEIADLLMLEEKILEVEAMLQGLGVDAGLFSTENSFCTVHYSLQETQLHAISLRFILNCAMSSLFWTLAAFFVLLMILVVGYGCAYVLVSLSDRTRGRTHVPETPAQTEAEVPPEDENAGV